MGLNSQVARFIEFILNIWREYLSLFGSSNLSNLLSSAASAFIDRFIEIISHVSFVTMVCLLRPNTEETAQLAASVSPRNRPQCSLQWIICADAPVSSYAIELGAVN